MPVVEKVWFLDDEPSVRFPLYCRGNSGEILPNVATPLSISITRDSFTLAFRELFGQSGAFTDAELAESASSGGLFGGYLYLNLSFARVFAVRVPGVGVGDVDRQMLGSSSVPPYVRRPGDRRLRTSVRALIGLARSTVGRTKIDLDARRGDVGRWLASLPLESTATDDQLTDLAASYGERFTENLRSLLDASLGSGLPLALIERMTRRVSRTEPGVALRLLSGIGTIETARPAAALWQLGRQVAASPTLGAVFDAGVRGSVARLEAVRDQDDVRRFLDDLQRFLDAYGHRGPDEVELASETWGTDPEIALAIVERLRVARAENDPLVAAERLSTERADATTRVRARLPRPVRPVFDRVLRNAMDGARRREQAKGTLVLDLHGLRRSLFELADRLVASGAITDRRAMFMVTIDELPKLVADPELFAAVIVERRARYDELNERTPPYFFEGSMPDSSTWPCRDAPSTVGVASVGDVLEGIGVASGRATGTARIVRDPADPRGIEPGDVLVAPITDPAWTPLFLTAVAVVVDVGAMQSHAAIVARELGIPAVVSVEGATGRLVDGMVLDVDGDHGTVTIAGPTVDP